MALGLVAIPLRMSIYVDLVKEHGLNALGCSVRWVWWRWRGRLMIRGWWSLPTGTVTLLFSDIEGSTLLLSRLGDWYVEALDAYRARLRSAWAGWGGREMGTEGDSFFVVFDVAADAVNAALQAQQALGQHDWADAPVRARMGMHTGSPVVHDGGYVGMDVHRAARIASAAHGGQAVASDVTARLATERLPAGRAGWIWVHIGSRTCPCPSGCSNCPVRLPDDLSLTEAQRSGAVQMIVDHDSQVRRGFTLTADNAADVTEVCRRLDGLPLALELAAARTKLLSPHCLLGRLDAALELRAPSTVDRPARQHTLRDTIAWSYQLLEPDRQAIFRRLSLFAGGADLDAVTALTNDLLPPGCDPLDPIGDLLDASLITVTDGPDGEPRIGMLETIRNYASEQLDATGEAEPVRGRHADHFQALADQLGEQIHGPEVLSARSQLDLELDNVRAVLEYRLQALERGDRNPDRIKAALHAANQCAPLISLAAEVTRRNADARANARAGRRRHRVPRTGVVPGKPGGRTARDREPG